MTKSSDSLRHECVVAYQYALWGTAWNAESKRCRVRMLERRREATVNVVSVSERTGMCDRVFQCAAIAKWMRAFNQNKRSPKNKKWRREVICEIIVTIEEERRAPRRWEEGEKNARDIAITKQTKRTFDSECSCFIESLLCPQIIAPNVEVHSLYEFHILVLSGAALTSFFVYHRGGFVVFHCEEKAIMLYPNNPLAKVLIIVHNSFSLGLSESASDERYLLFDTEWDR
jgi:hypothetical protein